jgi:hypothetical protein
VVGKVLQHPKYGAITVVEKCKPPEGAKFSQKWLCKTQSSDVVVLGTSLLNRLATANANIAYADSVVSTVRDLLNRVDDNERKMAAHNILALLDEYI